MSEEDGLLGIIRDSFPDPYVRLVAGIIGVAITDCRANPNTQDNRYRKIRLAADKRSAIDFIKGEYIIHLIHLADLNIDVKAVRQLLREELLKREQMTEIIKKSWKGYPSNRKSRKKVNNVLQTPPLICHNSHDKEVIQNPIL